MKNKNRPTKFPVARIKRIMQKDDEVGKVAQATPVVISKALEMFLALIIDEAHKVTAERGSKRVEAYHLKYAVDTTETLDFLKEIVEAVPDPSAGGTIDLVAEAIENAKKKRKSKRAGKAAEGAGGDAPAPKRRRKMKSEEQVKSDAEEDAARGSGSGDAGGAAESANEDGDEEMRGPSSGHIKDEDDYDDDDS